MWPPWRGRGGGEPRSSARRWRSRQIARGDLAQTLTLAAEFRPYQEIEVHAKVAGYVKAISVDVGDRVSAGQLLAVLEIPELQDDMATGRGGASKRSSEEVKRAAGRSRARRVGARRRPPRIDASRRA